MAAFASSAIVAGTHEAAPQEWYPWVPPREFDLSSAMIKFIQDLLLQDTVLDWPSRSDDAAAAISETDAGSSYSFRLLEDPLLFTLSFTSVGKSPHFPEGTSFCSAIINDAYRMLQSTEDVNRPRFDYIEKVQKCMNQNIRMLYVYKLIDAADKLGLQPCILHLGINCFDRYLSGNVVDRKNLHVVGIACLMIAFQNKEEEAPMKFEAWTGLAQNKFSMGEIMEMKERILDYMGRSKVTVPTAWTYLNRFVNAALVGKKDPMLLEDLSTLASYLADISLLLYHSLRYPPSLVATSCVFLAHYILNPFEKPWSATLQQYTMYKPSQLRDFTLKLHAFSYSIDASYLRVFRNKYNLGAKQILAKVDPKAFEDMEF